MLTSDFGNTVIRNWKLGGKLNNFVAIKFIERLTAAHCTHMLLWLQSGWGKRFGPDEEWSLAAENGENDPQYDDYAAPPSGGDFDDLMDEEKRAWRALNSGWGKRAANHDWSSFRGILLFISTVRLLTTYFYYSRILGQARPGVEQPERLMGKTQHSRQDIIVNK